MNLSSANKPEVSVVVGAHNEQSALQASLMSVLQQEGVNLELIVVDDGSTDGTADLLQALSQKDARLRVFSQEHQGLTIALIKGCQEARGQYIARHDIRDHSLANRLHKQVELIKRNSDTVLVTSGYKYVGPHGEFLGDTLPKHAAQDWQRILKSGDESTLHGPHHGTVMFRKDAYEIVGGYRSEFYFAQDLDLWTRMASVGKLESVPEVLYQASLSYDSISAQFGKQQRQLCGLIATATRCREQGSSEDDLLYQASLVRGPEFKNHTDTSDFVDADYFIGSCLVSLRDPVARRYLGRVLRRRPFYAKAWVKLLWSYSNGIPFSRQYNSSSDRQA